MTRCGSFAQFGPLFAAILLAVATTACKPHVWTPAPPAVAASPSKEGNPVWSSLAVNGEVQNPRWSAQGRNGQPLPPIADACKKEPYTSTCTDFPVVKDSAAGLNYVACSWFNLLPPLAGHADWLVAQYTGAIGWLNYADDADFNFMLFPEDDAGLTSNNHRAAGVQKQGEEPDSTRYIEVEFDPSESSPLFDSTWWRQLLGKAIEFADNGAVPVMNEHEPARLPLGVVSGLFGLDCEHGCRSEVHPVYALGIQTDDRAENNTWAIFVRNWGNGGFCSRYDHRLATAGNQIKILLPRTADGAPGVIGPDDYEFTSTAKAHTAPQFDFVPGKGVLVTFTLDDPAAHSHAELLVHLHWPAGSMAASYPELRYTDRQRVQSSMGDDHIETYLRSLRRRPEKPPPPPPPPPPPRANREIRVNRITALPAAAPPPPQGRLTIGAPKAEDTLLKDVCASFPPGQAPTDRIKELNKICDQIRAQKK